MTERYMVWQNGRKRSLTESEFMDFELPDDELVCSLDFPRYNCRVGYNTFDITSLGLTPRAVHVLGVYLGSPNRVRTRSDIESETGIRLTAGSLANIKHKIDLKLGVRLGQLGLQLETIRDPDLDPGNNPFYKLESAGETQCIVIRRLAVFA